MDTQDYSIRIEASVPVDEAFAGIQNVAAWWTKSFTGQARQAGDAFSVRFGSTFVDFSVANVVPEQQIVWQVASSSLPWLKNPDEWTGTRVVWDLSRTGTTTQIRMTHIGLAPQVECYGQCEAGWDFFVGQSLHQLLTQHQGMPDRRNLSHSRLESTPAGLVVLLKTEHRLAPAFIPRDVQAAGLAATLEWPVQPG